jgi:hypothetical protein
MKETIARPKTLMPAELICTRKPSTIKSNDGEYEVVIPLIYLTEALITPAQFYKFRFKGLLYAK